MIFLSKTVSCLGIFLKQRKFNSIRNGINRFLDSITFQKTFGIRSWRYDDISQRITFDQPLFKKRCNLTTENKSIPKILFGRMGMIYNLFSFSLGFLRQMIRSRPIKIHMKNIVIIFWIRRIRNRNGIKCSHLMLNCFPKATLSCHFLPFGIKTYFHNFSSLRFYVK